MRNYVWVAYDKAPPGLPVAVAETAVELAQIIGTTRNNVVSTYSHYAAGHVHNSRFHKVKIEEDIL